MIGTAKRNIIVVPCMVKIWLYMSGPIRLFSGRASCARIIAASIPPSRKKTKAVVMYRFPICLWFVVVSHPHNPGFDPHTRSICSRSALSSTGTVSPIASGGAVI